MPSIITSFLLDAEEDGLRCTSLADGPMTPVDITVPWPVSLTESDLGEPDYDVVTDILTAVLEQRLHEAGYLPVSPTALRNLMYRVVAPGPGGQDEPVFKAAATSPARHPLQDKADDTIRFADTHGWGAYAGYVDDGEAIIVVLRGDKATKARAALLAVVDMVMHDA